MTTGNPVDTGPAEVVAIVGSSSFSGSQLLLHLESQAVECRLVAVDTTPLRWPINGASAHRMGINYGGENVTLDDIPDLLRLEFVDTLVHVGSHFDGSDRDSFLADTARWVDACRESGVRQFVYLSDCRVYGTGNRANPPVSERADVDPPPNHRSLALAEPRSRLPQNIDPPPGAMRLAVMRTAMTVGPSGASPAAEEFLASGVRIGKRNAPLQFLHEHDLVRGVVAAVRHRLYGIYHLAGDGSVFSQDVGAAIRSVKRDAPKRSQGNRSGRFSYERLSPGSPAYPTVLSTTKFKQAAQFSYKYSSAQAFRAYCHSVLFEPQTSL